MPGTSFRFRGYSSLNRRSHKLPPGGAPSPPEMARRADSGVTDAGGRARRAWRHSLKKMPGCPMCR